ncbi:MAG: Gfo/Idh/MocA family oxidoreductase [Acidimicrobiia bacterium]
MNGRRPRQRRDEPVRVAVIGVGGMGSSHARVYSGLKGAELVAVVDTDRARADEVARLYGCRALDSVDEVVDDLDAVSVTVPSGMHAEIGCVLLERGIACLVEKPLATTEAGGRALIDAARRGGAPLLVGHIERFNPAVAQLREILSQGHQILALEARRMSAVSSRVTDIDVVTDLMVHDLDIVLDLVGADVVDISARGVLRGGVPGDDFVTALVTFAGGTLAVLTASRVTQNTIRQLQVTTDHRFFTVDYANQELQIYRQGRIGALGDRPEPGSLYVLDVGTERVFLRRTEPLVAELTHFLSVCRRQVEPRVTGQQALAALDVVWEIRRQVEASRARA